MESGNLLLDKMTEEKRKIWEEVITSTNMTHNSRKAWKTINKISNDPTSSNPPCLVTANQVAHQLLVNDRGTMPPKPKRPVLPQPPIHTGREATHAYMYRAGRVRAPIYRAMKAFCIHTRTHSKPADLWCRDGLKEAHFWIRLLSIHMWNNILYGIML